MIFDGLPIMSAGGGTKIAGPHFYVMHWKYRSGKPGPWTLRLDGKGVVTFFGEYLASSGCSSEPIIYTLSSSIYRTLEIDGNTYGKPDTPSTLDSPYKFLDGGYGDVVLYGGNKSYNTLPTTYVFYEYLEVVIAETSGDVNHYGIQYYDLDADNPVTVTFA